MLKIELHIIEREEGIVDVKGIVDVDDEFTETEAACAADLCTIMCNFLESKGGVGVGLEESMVVH